MDETNGFIVDNFLGGRVFILSGKLMSEMRRLLAQSMSKPAADALLWHIGNRYGLALAQKAKQISASPEQAVDLLATSAQKSGWGKIRVLNNAKSTGRIDTFFENCVFCEGLVGETEMSCHFLSGILAGIADGLYGPGFSAVEKRCRSVSGNTCEFVISRQ